MPPIKRRAQIAAAAVRAGHELEVDRSAGKRFRLVCTCGFRTPINWTRKHTFDVAADHIIRAGRTALGEEPALGRIPPAGEPGYSGVSEPGSVGADL